MNKLEQIFKKGKVFIAYLTAGDPTIISTRDYVMELINGGADIIEIGVPFSDPVADGTTVQAANMRALENKISLKDIFHMVQSLSKEYSTPFVLLSYFNSIYSYGTERFFADCSKHGISGVVIPDLPYEERDEVEIVSASNKVAVITLIAPTSDERVKMLATKAKGFIYLVSSLGVTGIRSEIDTDLRAIINTIREVTNTPVAVGFGIATPLQAKEIASISDGVIVGSAIIKLIEKGDGTCHSSLREFAASIKDAIAK